MCFPDENVTKHQLSGLFRQADDLARTKNDKEEVRVKMSEQGASRCGYRRRNGVECPMGQTIKKPNWTSTYW